MQNHRILLLPFFFLFISTFLISQNKVQSISLNIGITQTNPVFQRNTIMSLFEEKFEPKLGIQVNSLVELEINPILSFALGLKYVNANYRNTIDKMLFPKDIVDQTLTKVVSDIKVHNLGFPFIMNWKLKRDLDLIKINTGINVYSAFTTGSSERIVTGGGKGTPSFSKNNELKKMNISSLIGISYLKPISPKLRISISPSIEFFHIAEEQFISKTNTNNLAINLLLGIQFQH